MFIAAHRLSLVAMPWLLTACGAQALGAVGFSSCGARAVAPQHVESSWTRDWTHVPCIGRQILIHQGSPRDSFISSIMVCVSHINFSCHVALARTSGTVLNRNGKSRNSCSWSQGGRFILSPLSMILTVGFLLMLAIKLREFSSVPIFLRVYIMNRCGILWKKLLHCMIWLCDFFL